MLRRAPCGLGGLALTGSSMTKRRSVAARSAGGSSRSWERPAATAGLWNCEGRPHRAQRRDHTGGFEAGGKSRVEIPKRGGEFSFRDESAWAVGPESAAAEDALPRTCRSAKVICRPSRTLKHGLVSWSGTVWEFTCDQQTTPAVVGGVSMLHTPKGCRRRMLQPHRRNTALQDTQPGGTSMLRFEWDSHQAQPEELPDRFVHPCRTHRRPTARPRRQQASSARRHEQRLTVDVTRTVLAPREHRSPALRDRFVEHLNRAASCQRQRHRGEPPAVDARATAALVIKADRQG